MEPTHLPPQPDVNPPADDQLLEDLASITGLFNPELIWKKEETLDDLSEDETPAETE